MSYLNVLPLADAKLYLRIDDLQTEDDLEITTMIRSSFSYLEKRTNVLVYAREKDYDLDEGCVRVYDFPINSQIGTDQFTITKKKTYSIYQADDTELPTLSLNVGYSDPANVPPEIIDAAKMMLKVWYYESEKQSNTTLIPEAVKEVIESNRRFIL